MARKTLAMTLISVGILILTMSATADEKAVQTKIQTKQNIVEPNKKAIEGTWARDDVSRGVVTFKRGGSGGVVTFRHGGTFHPLFNFSRGGSRREGCFDFRR